MTIMTVSVMIIIMVLLIIYDVDACDNYNKQVYHSSRAVSDVYNLCPVGH
jgi:hypothetical protein